MRNALWYYENYFIQRDLSESKDNVIEGLESLVGQWESAFYVQTEKVAIAERRSSNWAVFSFTAGTIAALMIALEFINAYQNKTNSDT